MHAVILAGGKGTRLRPYTTVLPKPLMPIGDMPILEIVLRQLAGAGVTRVTVAVSYLAELIQAFCGDGSRFGLDVRYSRETRELSTAGPLKLIPDLDDTFLVMNGDVLTTLDYGRLFEAHRASGAAATAAIHSRRVKIDLGVVEPAPDGSLGAYIEKPTYDFKVSMGINVLEPRAIAHIAEDETLGMPDLLLRLKAAGETVMTHETDCLWLDIGREDDYRSAIDTFEERRDEFLGGLGGTMRVLVTGIRSFTGRHLVERLRADPRTGGIGGADLGAARIEGVDYRPCDVRDRDDLTARVAECAPDAVIHLAGVARGSEDDCFEVNLGGTRNLIAAAAARPDPPRLVVVSSAAVYGLTRPEESPVVETCPLRPVGAYGASKAAAELAALAAHRRGIAPVVVVRPFNLVGPGLPGGFAPSDFLDQALALRGRPGRGQIRVGNLDPKRDFIDVRDAVAAYADLAHGAAGDGGTFNVASGRPRAIREILDLALVVAGVEADVVPDAARVRPVEVGEQVGDASALAAATGWSPTIELRQSIEDMARVPGR